MESCTVKILKKLKTIEIFSDIFIHIGSSYFIAAIFIMGLFFKNHRGLCVTAILSLGFSFFLNPILKNIWQLPLKFSAHTYAFPSGHSHAIAAFFSVLFFGVSRNYKIGIGVILICYAWAINRHGYHEWFEIIGGQYFGIVQGLIFYLSYKAIQKYLPYKNI